MKEKISNIALISVGILSALILFFAFAEYVLPVIMPFIIAWMAAAITASPARSLSRKIKAPESVIRLVMSLFGTIAFFLTAALLVWRISISALRFLTDMGEGNRLYDLLSRILSVDIPLLGNLPEGLADRINSAVGDIISRCMSGVADWLASFAGSLPRSFIFLLVTLISIIYFALDYDKITSFVKSILPEKTFATLEKLRQTVIDVLKRFISSYAVIMLITYIIILLGLWILRVAHAPLLALLIALLDILPIIGVGTVLVPWSIFEIAAGNRSLGIGLLLLFVVNSVVRQLIEPKIVGKSLDLHPIVTLMTIYVGYALFGLPGMLILPLAAVSLGSMLKRNNSSNVA